MTQKNDQEHKQFIGTSMTNDEFDRLVRRLEQEAQHYPRRYKATVFGLAVLGYAYVLLVIVVLAILIALLGLLMMTGKGLILLKKAAIPLIALVGVIVRSLWVRLSPPEGIRLTPRDYPALYTALADIRRKLRGPRIHVVLLDDEFNAGVSQVPRLGLFGWQKNYLVLGLPLMQALSPEQFLAVLAHEYGHLAGAHSRFGSWIYRVRRTWSQLMEALSKDEHWGKFVFARFFAWYAPFFSAYSFVLARANEYEADACSAAIVDPRQAADALITYRLKANFLHQRFWPQLYGQADRLPQPAFSPYMELTSEMHKEIGPGEAQDWIDQALNRETGTEDTHPALKDRLAALGQTPRIPPVVAETAAQYFLADQLPMLADRFDAEWRERTHDSWSERHEYVRSSTERLQELETAKAQGDLSESECYEYARLAEEFRPEAHAVDLYRDVLALNPNHVSAHYQLGRVLLEAGDETGVAHIEKVMEADEDAITDGCKLIYNYLVDHDREEEAKRYADRYHKQVAREHGRQRERDELSQDDRLIPHGLDDQQIQQLIEHLRRYSKITKAFLAQKALEHSAKPLYVLGITRTWWTLSGADGNQKLVKKLVSEMNFPGETFVVLLDADKKRLAKSLRRVPGSRIYSR